MPETTAFFHSKTSPRIYSREKCGLAATLVAYIARWSEGAIADRWQNRSTLLPELSCSTAELVKAFEVPASALRCALIKLRTPALHHPDFRSSQRFPIP